MPPQLAVLRFENLSTDPSLDWMGRGFAEIISGALDGSPQLYAIQWNPLHSFDRSLGPRPIAAPGISAERQAALASGANHLVYGQFTVVNGTLRATASEEDPARKTIVRVITASGPVADGIFPVANQIARQLGPVRAFGTHDQRALQDYVAGLEAADPASALQGFAQAAAADPQFGRAYVYWAAAAISQRNREEAENALEMARAHFAGLSELDRTRLELDAATLRGDFKARLDSLTTLTRLDPQDPNNHRALGEAYSSIRKFEDAIVEFRRGLTIQPDDVLGLNSMGYAAAYAGDLPTAIRVLRGYEQLRPVEPNPLDSLGDVHFALGHYGEAEQFYLAAQAKSPGFLNGGEFLKPGQARLMTGDIQGATALFERFLGERRRAHDPLADFHAAGWAWNIGQRRGAIQGLDALAAGAEKAETRPIASRANAQAALWLLQLGDQAGARDRAAKAFTDAGPADVTLAIMVNFLAQPGAPLPPTFGEPLQPYAQAYAALLAKDFAHAQQALEKIYARPTQDPDDGIAVLLAWCYLETGQWQKAEPLLRLNPIPQASTLPIFSSWQFPRLFFLRAELIEKEGQRKEAAPNYQVFLKLSGPDAEIWGEQEAAARALR